MTKQPFGFPERASCQHAFVFRELGGVALRCCEGCGLTHLLWQFDDGQMALLPVREGAAEDWSRVATEKAQESAEEDTVDDTLADVVESLLSVSPGEDERPVPSKRRQRRRAAQPVPDVQEPEQPTLQESGASQ